jgi:hypothetical protein
MRDIEFRAWDNRQNKYLNPDDVSIRADGFITAFNVDGKHSRAVQPPGSLSPWFVIEQYTGLKDKNGIEIYEGDIVKVEGDGEIYRVKWIRSGFGLEPRYNSPRYPVLGNVELRKKIEVVSNIHENPELLEEK